MISFSLIQNKSQLNTYLELIKDSSLIAIDTEFKRINSYYPELCLIQIATGNHLECIDVLAIKDLEPLFEKIYEKDTIWIIHSARQDIEALYYLSKRLPQKLFDTQIAASLLNFPTQVSYQVLTETLQNVYLEKKHTRFDWTIRPLPKDVLQYALDDVKYLIPNYEILKSMLLEEGKIDWLNEEVGFLLDKELYEPNFNQIIKKTNGISKIDSNSQKIAINLLMWREETAQKKNKPRKWIMSDENLINYATNKSQLSFQSSELFEAFLNRIKASLRPQELLSTKKPLSADEKIKKNQILDHIETLSKKHNIAPEIICSSKNVTKFIRGDKDISINNGWRSKIFEI